MRFSISNKIHQILYFLTVNSKVYLSLQGLNKQMKSNIMQTSQNSLKVAKAGHKSEGHIGMMADMHDGQ